MKTVYILIAATISFTVGGQLLIKAGTLEVGDMPSQPKALPGFFFLSLTNFKVVIGLLLAVLAALTWMGAVSISDISFAYPFMSLAIVLVLALSGVFFGEDVPINRWLGVIIVCFGLMIAARS